MMAKNLSDIDTRRKNRVSRLKKNIIIGLCFSILIPIILCIILLLKVMNLQKQIDVLYESRNNTEIYLIDEKKEGFGETNVAYAKEISDEREQAEDTLDETLMVSKDENLIDTSASESINVARKVYLTFDDGPSQNTDDILDILKEYDVKATFFVIGKEDEYSKEIYRRIVDEGHSLGLHSYTHNYSIIYDSVEAFANDISRLIDHLYDITGVKTTMFRFPGGSSNLVSDLPMEEFIAYLNEEKITYYDWNVSGGDATTQEVSVDTVFHNVITDVSKFHKSIVLMHDADDKTNTVKALPKIIEELIEMGADIEKIDSKVTPIQHIKAESVN